MLICFKENGMKNTKLLHINIYFEHKRTNLSNNKLSSKSDIHLYLSLNEDGEEKALLQNRLEDSFSKKPINLSLSSYNNYTSLQLSIRTE